MDIKSLNSSIAGQLDQANLNVGQGNLERVAANASDKDAGKKFEAMLGTMLAKEMRKGLDEGFFGKGPGADSFSGWLDEYVGQVMAEQGTFGTATLVNNHVADVEGAPVAADAMTESFGESESAVAFENVLPVKASEANREAE